MKASFAEPSESLQRIEHGSAPMSRQLSQEEIDSFFDSRSAAGASKTAVAFDFRKLDRLPKAQVAAIHLLHETFVRNLTSSLTAYLRTYLSANLISVEQLRYAEFLETLASPTCMVSLSMRPYSGHAVLEINPTVVFPIIDLLLGGKGKIKSSLSRELTDIEQDLLEGVLRIIASNLAETWKGMTKIEFKVDSIDTEPQLSQVMSQTEAVVAIGIEIRIGEYKGMMNLAIPSITLKSMDQLFEQQWKTRRERAQAKPEDGAIQVARRFRCDVVPALQGMKISAASLVALKPGDVVNSCIPVGNNSALLVNGSTHSTGHMIDRDGQALFCIDELQRI
jgi:flagellar motor switch protein FliM